MANHKSALKRILQSEKRRIQNRVFRNRTRTLVKNARTLVHSGKDVSAAEAATMTALRDLDMLASKGTIHKNNAARRKSRLMKQLNALKAKSKA
jgi:small subunit ribosomal protein S20